MLCMTGSEMITTNAITTRVFHLILVFFFIVFSTIFLAVVV